jgi:hypothetical protein
MHDVDALKENTLPVDGYQSVLPQDTAGDNASVAVAAAARRRGGGARQQRRRRPAAGICAGAVAGAAAGRALAWTPLRPSGMSSREPPSFRSY